MKQLSCFKFYKFFISFFKFYLNIYTKKKLCTKTDSGGYGALGTDIYWFEIVLILP